jgi:hypothetical protein
MVAFRLRGLKYCRAPVGTLRANGRARKLTATRLDRAIRHGTLRVVVLTGSVSLSIVCGASGATATTKRPRSGPPPPPSSTIAPAPEGPAAPNGGWSIEYGDAFKESICGAQGTSVSSGGCDNTLYPNRNAGGCSNIAGYNSDEMEQFNCAAVNVSANGLDLSCTPATGLTTPSGYVASHYACGAVQSQDTSVPAGYRFFTWKPGQGQEWAVQIVAQFPRNTGEADPGWWSSAWVSSEELDFFEGFGLQAGKNGSWCTAGSGSNGYIGTTMPTWIYDTNSGANLEAESNICHDLGFDPSAGFHTYTTVIYPNNTLSEYVDGKADHWSYVPNGGADHTSGGDVIGPPPSLSNATMGLVLSYALRADTTGDPDPYFTSGTRNFVIRSIAVYENTSASGANAFNGGLAPGTSIG